MTAYDRDVPKLEAGPTRLETLETKIPREQSKLNGSIFVHVDYDPKNKNKIDGIRISEKGKDGSSLDRILHLISDAITESVRSLQPPEGA